MPLGCGTFVIGEPTTSGPVSAAPRVRRGKELRSALILRLFAIERFVRAIVFGLLAYGIWRFKSSQLTIDQAFNRELPALRELLRQLGFNVNHSKLLGLIQHALTLNPGTLTWLALAAAGYAVIEIIEAVGLWLLKRWGEYFAMVATSVGIPYEIYDLTTKVTVLRVGPSSSTWPSSSTSWSPSACSECAAARRPTKPGCAANPSCKRRSMPWRGRPAHPAPGRRQRRPVPACAPTTRPQARTRPRAM
jgi:uncharacterized membrane protein (DUF2068 family)